MSSSEDSDASSSGPHSCLCPDFGFAFDNAKFSDCTLRIRLAGPCCLAGSELAARGKLPQRAGARGRAKSSQGQRASTTGGGAAEAQQERLAVGVEKQGRAVRGEPREAAEPGAHAGAAAGAAEQGHREQGGKQEKEGRDGRVGREEREGRQEREERQEVKQEREELHVRSRKRVREEGGAEGKEEGKGGWEDGGAEGAVGGEGEARAEEQEAVDLERESRKPEGQRDQHRELQQQEQGGGQGGEEGEEGVSGGQGQQQEQEPKQGHSPKRARKETKGGESRQEGGGNGGEGRAEKEGKEGDEGGKGFGEEERAKDVKLDKGVAGVKRQEGEKGKDGLFILSLLSFLPHSHDGKEAEAEEGKRTGALPTAEEVEVGGKTRPDKKGVGKAEEDTARGDKAEVSKQEEDKADEGGQGVGQDQGRRCHQGEEECKLSGAPMDDAGSPGEAKGSSRACEAAAACGRKAAAEKKREEEDEEECVEAIEEESVWEVAVCSTILASRSLFFRRMFELGFADTRNTRNVLDICVARADYSAFLQVLKFMYTGVTPRLKALPKQECFRPQGPMPQLSDFEAAELEPLEALEHLRLLLLADRFDVPQLLSACAKEVSRLPYCCFQGALLLLQLPEALLRHPMLKEELLQAQKSVAGEAFEWNVDKRFPVKLVFYPNWAMVDLLESDLLQTCLSEDDVLDFALIWARTKSTSDEATLRLLSEVVWPGIRPDFLSPAKVRDFARVTMEGLSELLGMKPEASGRLEFLCRSVRERAPCVVPCDATRRAERGLSRAIAATQVEVLLQAGLFPLDKFAGFCARSSVIRERIIGEEGFQSIFWEIPLRQARSWKEEGDALGTLVESTMDPSDCAMKPEMFRKDGRRTLGLNFEIGVHSLRVLLNIHVQTALSKPDFVKLESHEVETGSEGSDFDCENVFKRPWEELLNEEFFPCGRMLIWASIRLFFLQTAADDVLYE